MDLEGLYVPHDTIIYTRQMGLHYQIRPTARQGALDSRRQGETAAARSTRVAKAKAQAKAQAKEKQDDAARATRIQKRNEDLERSTVGRALCDSSEDESPKATSTQKTTLKSVPNSLSLAAKAAVTTAPIEISDEAALDALDALDEAIKITFSSREEALVAVISDNLDIAEAAEMYLDPFADQDEEEAEDVAQEPFTLPLHQKRSAEEALDSTRSTTSSKRQRGPCRHCRNSDHAYAMCPDR
ncbi:hypothetical protein EG328_008367 [Venturia inaequalis]|uniref:Uncharacterized protein n=1 Tax=Venturia inaequalis TaxID=5025 RepID=A0A8H3V921_VENIN|nr:hypothetical protein EG328_008367 [Venturia inaequalis]